MLPPPSASIIPARCTSTRKKKQASGLLSKGSRNGERHLHTGKRIEMLVLRLFEVMTFSNRLGMGN
jgi:hypothetical protein